MLSGKSKLTTFSNKHIIITGASSGIGMELALELAKEGASVCLGSRNLDKLEKVKTQINSFGGKCVIQKCDVTERNDCENLMAFALEQFGKLDVLINNAGLSMRGAFSDTQTEVLERLIDVNYWGTVHCTKAALPHLLETKGSLVAVSSVIGFKGIPGRSGYTSSKFAIHGLYESIRIENLHNGLHVLIACPGYTKSKIRYNALDPEGTPMNNSALDESKMDEPKDVAHQIMQAIRDRKDFMLNNKTGKTVFWMNKLFPRILERKIHKVVSNEPNSPIKNI